MAELGNKNRVYIGASTGSTYTWLAGEQTNSFNRSAESIEVSDKSTEWAQFISGKKSATADVTVIADNADAQQKSLLTAFAAGTPVLVHIGKVNGTNAGEGDTFSAIITSINDTNDSGAVSTRQISLQSTGVVEHVDPS